MTLMKTTPRLHARATWSSVLIVIGGIALVLGAVDPLEGSLIILPGSGLVALGTFLKQNGRRQFAFRVSVFALVAVGVGALWGLSMAGGIGGKSGHSLWWALLILPYLVGWSLSIWGPGSPRWLLMLGVMVGLWYLVIVAMMLKGPSRPHGDRGFAPMIAIGSLGIVTIGGCLGQLTRRSHGLGEGDRPYPSQ